MLKLTATNLIYHSLNGIQHHTKILEREHTSIMYTCIASYVTACQSIYTVCPEMSPPPSHFVLASENWYRIEHT